MLQPIVHYTIHFGLPILVALTFYRSIWWRAYLVMIAAMLIDLDHLIADPIFDANRCSINFHPLHSYYAIVVYFLFLIPKKTRILGIGLVIHILADSADCWLMQG